MDGSLNPVEANPTTSVSVSRQGGFSLIEVMIAMTLVVVIVQSLVSGALYLSNSSSAGTWKNEAQAKIQRSIHKLSNELRMSMTDVDASTGMNRYSIGGPAGNRRLAFFMVVDWANNGAEVVPIWSSLVQYYVEDGWLTREQDGAQERIQSATEWFEVLVDSLGRFEFEIGVERTSGQQSQNVRSGKTVTPMF